MDKYYLLTFKEDWADEHNVPALACFNEKDFEKWKDSKQELRAHLGNGGDGFMENEQGLTGSELIKKKIVSKLVVDKSFYSTFNKAGLSDLSLCNVFENEYEEDEDEEE